MKIVSLDQVALSFLGRRGEKDQDWKKVLCYLVSQVKAGKILCPTPYETVLETAPLQGLPHERLRGIQEQLSRGVYFKSFEKILAEEVLAIVRPEMDVAPFEVRDWDDLHYERFGSASASELKYFKSRIESQFASLVIDRSNASLKYKEMLKLFRGGFASNLYCNLELVKNGQPPNPGPLITTYIYKFLAENRLTHEEIDLLRERILHHKYEAIPVLFFYLLLIARLEFDLLSGGGPRPQINDDVDLTRTATALWAADAYICEGAMAEVCKKSKVSEFTHVQVLSVRNVKGILKWLEKFAT